MMIENSKFDKSTVEAMKAGSQAVTANQQQMNIDELEDLHEDIAEQQANAAEVQEYFANIAGENHDEMMDELD